MANNWFEALTSMSCRLISSPLGKKEHFFFWEGILTICRCCMGYLIDLGIARLYSTRSPLSSFCLVLTHYSKPTGRLKMGACLLGTSYNNNKPRSAGWELHARVLTLGRETWTV